MSTLFSSLKRIVFVGGEQIHSPKISGKKESRMWQSQWLCSEPADCHLGLGQMLRIWACLKSRALPACCRPETTRGELCAAPHLPRGGTHQRSRRKGFQNIHQLDHGVRIHSFWMLDLHVPFQWFGSIKSGAIPCILLWPFTFFSSICSQDSGQGMHLSGCQEPGRDKVTFPPSCSSQEGVRGEPSALSNFWAEDAVLPRRPAHRVFLES